MKNESSTLSIYLKEINKIPLLSHDEEIVLAKEAQNGSVAAKNKMINANLRFVVNVAKKYQNRGLELEELISEGNIGLMTAIDKFDVSKGYHFISYAVWWIRQSITKAISEKASPIRLPVNRINELNQIKTVQKTLGRNISDEQEIREIAEMLNLPEDHVRDMMNISRDIVSLDAPVSASDDIKSTVGDFVEEDRYETPYDKVINDSMKDDLDSVLNTLKPNEQKVIRLRYGLDGRKPMSLKEVGDECKLTKERIRQIEKHAIVRLQHPVRANVLKSYVA